MKHASSQTLTRAIFKEESGYSLVEVMVAIMLLAIAIIPMVGMFDAALRAAVLGGNYDQARALANEKLEEVKALPYDEPGGAANSVVEIYPPGMRACTGTIPSPFSCQVQTTYARFDNSSGAVVTDSTARTMMEVEVTVRWDGNDPSCGGSTKCYTTTGLVSK